jgi:hypothetical protein
MNNIHTYMYIYNVSTYIKNTHMSLYNTFRMQLIWWLLQLMGHINLLMDENKCKINSTNRMKFGLVVANIFSNLVINDYKSHVIVNGLVTFWLISTSVQIFSKHDETCLKTWYNMFKDYWIMPKYGYVHTNFHCI